MKLFTQKLPGMMLLLGFLIFAFNVNAENVQLKPGSKTAIEIKDNSINGFRAINMVNDIYSFEVKTDNGIFSEFTIPGYTYYQEIGSPKLPVNRKLIEVPAGANPVIEIISEEYDEYNLSELGIDVPIIPAQPAYPKSSDIPPPFEYNGDVYSQDSYWGNELVSIEVLGYLRGLQLGRLDISPVQYNPVSGTVRIYSHIEYTVVFENADLAKTIEDKAKNDSPFFSGLNTFIFNHTPLNNRDTISKPPYKFLIVSDRMFEEQLQPFIEWKTKKGFTVVVGYTDEPEVGTTTSSIKSYIQDLYDAGTPEDPAPTFVLFVGDVDQIPAWNASGATDLEYCEYTGDYFPEIYYGRFSANNPTELQPQIDKTLQYEQYTMPDPTYLEEVVLVAGVDGSHGHDWGNGQINYGTENYFNEAHGIVSHIYLYPESGSSSSQIRQNISDGVGFANYTAHCSSDGWADPSFVKSHIPALENQDMYGLLIGNCCSSSTYDYTECFAEAILRVENKGAVGYIGGSNSTYWDEDYYFGVGVGAITEDPPSYEETTLGCYDGLFHDHGEPFADYYITQDQVIFAGNLAVTEGSPSSAQYYWDIYNIMGDPSVITYLGIPEEMIVSYDQLMPLSTATFTVTAAPFSYVAISKDGVLHGSALADESGMAVVNLDPITVPGTADVIVTGQNFQPYIGTVTVASPEGPYVLFNSFEIDDSDANNNGQADFGESIKLNMTLENVGNSDATGLTATISCDDEFITLTNAVHEWSDIPTGSTINQDDAFAFDVADLIPDNHNVVIDLEVTDGTETWNSSFSFKIFSPVLLVGRMTVDDSKYGDGNGRLDPGEMATIFVNSKNEGHSDAPGVSAILATTNEFVTINTGTFIYGNLIAEGEFEASFDITVDPTAPIGNLAELMYQVQSDPYMAEKSFMPKIGLIIEDFETGDFESFDWAFSGDADWTLTDEGAYDGMYCAKSGTIGDESTSVLSVTIDVMNDDSISFYRKVSSEQGWDYLKFYIDNDMQDEWSGEASWDRVVYFVSAGEHTFKWEYYKDYSYASGSDCAWVDDIVFPSMDGSGGEFSLRCNAVPDYVCYGGSTQLISIPSGGSGNYVYNWSPSETLSDPNIFNPVASPMETTVYLVEVNDGDNAIFDEITIEVLAVPDAPTIIQEGVSLVSNTEEGNQWYFWGILLEDATEQMYTPTGTGEYYATVSDTYCESMPSNVIYFMYTGIDDQNIVDHISLYPNPFTDNMMINYTISENTAISIIVYNALGEKVRVLLNSKSQAAGSYQVELNSSGLEPGVYYCGIETSKGRIVEKIILSK